MPLEKDRCPCCNEKQIRCPECGSKKVTPRDNLYQETPTKIVNFGGEEEGEITYNHVCWECGWDEEVTIKIERE